ncbi:AbrB/MazE/SpoVT family DNA-binding domain-containing protein [Geodermatophilus sp. YIM 151500]|uniref:AbrB/MazE/SpoVT family DNA-binding domain-containing protein n=1 Tax=Geodermatophilus sp. YIM 151500 TaxID=2984531 RepID=UPI0021E510B7|nr:AbrB/MazE/SpoVT family DNA-binding domain-containing protein [Geodermatophilus sp. YIM 151500]MCV2490729.1 AbrB/MazE/SpoVT family DNA-binding domain-containing protein [Geodermatophilus sp. YIM 151500]
MGHHAAGTSAEKTEVVGVTETGGGSLSDKDATRVAPRVRRLGASSVKVHAYVTVQRRGTVALPPALRHKHHLDEPGAQVEITEREDGVLELRPLVAGPRD